MVDRGATVAAARRRSRSASHCCWCVRSRRTTQSLIEHRAVSSLSVSEAKSLGLPPIADVVCHLETTGIIARPDFRIKLSWRRASGQPIVGAKRTGAWLRVGNDWQRLPDALFEIAEGVDRLNATPRRGFGWPSQGSRLAT